MVVFDVLAPFFSSSPQSRGKGIRSPPVERRWRVCLSSFPNLRPQLSPEAHTPEPVPVVKEVDTGGERLSPQIARSWAL